MSSLVVRVGSSATISSACAWWPIIPCMNVTSAGVAWTCDRSRAWSAAIMRLGWPGAPGWTICGVWPALGAAFTGAERHDVKAPAASSAAATGCR